MSMQHFVTPEGMFSAVEIRPGDPMGDEIGDEGRMGDGHGDVRRT